MVVQGTIRRFARWGLTHGPVWGMVAGALAGLPLAGVLELSMSWVELLVLGALAGLIGGPMLAVLVGAVCLAADRAPRWILDAPDYVAVATVLAVIGAIAWLTLADAGTALLVVVLMAAAPMVDAARSAPRLLHPQRAQAS